MTKNQFIGNIIIAVISGFILAITLEIKMPGDIITNRYGYPELLFGGLHIFINIIFGMSSMGLGFLSLMILGPFQDGKFKVGKDPDNNFKFPKINKYKITLSIICGFLLVFMINLYSHSKFIYNKSIIYHNNYNQKVQEKLGFYDKLWKTYLQKEKITNLNKETFIQVTSLIMENRKDGNQVAWKWVQENQQIPYSEFTSFYKDLSLFIESQREEYFNIEKQCQVIANSNNTLLDTLPNNIYNKIIGCERIKFEYGFLSEKTNQTFISKQENLRPQ